MITAEATLTKWGNGRGALFPKSITDDMGVDIGDKIHLVYDEATRTLRIERKGAYTLHALMDGYTGPKPGEIDAPGASVGGELW